MGLVRHSFVPGIRFPGSGLIAAYTGEINFSVLVAMLVVIALIIIIGSFVGFRFFSKWSVRDKELSVTEDEIAEIRQILDEEDAAHPDPRLHPELFLDKKKWFWQRWFGKRNVGSEEKSGDER